MNDDVYGTATAILRRSLRGHLYSLVVILCVAAGAYVLAILHEGTLFGLALVAPMLVLLITPIGFITVLPEQLRAVGIFPQGLIFRRYRRALVRVSWRDLQEARISYAAIGKLGPSGGRTRSVLIKVANEESISVSDAEFRDVDALLNALLKFASGRVVDERT